MYKNLKNSITNNFKNNFWINVIVFFYLTTVLVNFFHNNYNPYEKIENKIENVNSQIFTKAGLENSNLQIYISNELTSEKGYSFILDRTCKITGDMHDRHKVRWVKSIFLKKIFNFSEQFGQTAPYYLNIFLHSLVLFLTFFLINNSFTYNKKYNYLFLVYITFIFQQYLGEYSYSIFEMFFLSLALYASKEKKIYIFFLACALAVLNRESGFIILLTWFIFNDDIRKILLIAFLTVLLFLILNLDLMDCLINPKFFIPLENQVGQINYLEMHNANIFSNFKLLFLNLLLPFGLIFYFVMNSSEKNKALITVSVLYFLAFTLASPAHHMAIKMILLPIIFVAIHFSQEKREII